MDSENSEDENAGNEGKQNKSDYLPQAKNIKTGTGQSD